MSNGQSPTFNSIAVPALLSDEAAILWCGSNRPDDMAECKASYIQLIQILISLGETGECL